MKVIYLSTKTFGAKDKYYPVGSDGFYLFGIGQFIAQEFVKRDYDIKPEVWRVDNRVYALMEKRVEGIFCRIFPAQRFFGKKLNFSIKMAFQLRKEANNPETVFHFTNTHLPHFEIYAMFVGANRVIASHLGNPNPLWRYKKKKKLKYWVAYQMEKHIFSKYYKKIYTICKAEKKYYEKINTPVEYSIVYGVCREDQFIIKDKFKSREKLGLPKEKKIILQVGRAVEYRGFDWILKLIDKYENKKDHLFLMVGINEWDPYYNELKKRENCIVIGYTDHRKLVDYYNSADIFIFFIVGEKVLTFGGTGYVPIEAMLCGLPVIATSLHHIKGFGIEEVARIPNTEDDVMPMLEGLFKNPPLKEKCREVALRIFSWETVLNNYWNDYQI